MVHADSTNAERETLNAETLLLNLDADSLPDPGNHLLSSFARSRGSIRKKHDEVGRD